ncbi:creatininase family protein [Mangrovactinospora gilvigrisea]|nr:creatininase family protein [Mangrovactinospora gilvigrisea]
MQGFTKSGVIGFASKATAEKGRAVLDSLTVAFQSHLAALDET